MKTVFSTQQGTISNRLREDMLMGRIAQGEKITEKSLSDEDLISLTLLCEEEQTSMERAYAAVRAP